MQMNKLKLNLKQKMALSLVIFIVLLLSIIYFVVLPAVGDIISIKTDIEKERLDLEKKYIRGQSLRKISEKLEKVEGRINILDQVFIKKDKSLEFITALEREASKNNVEQKIKLLASANSDYDYSQSIPIQLMTQGSLANQLNYLVGLEALNYYINIGSLDVNINKGEDDSSLFISADTFWQE